MKLPLRGRTGAARSVPHSVSVFFPAQHAISNLYLFVFFPLDKDLLTIKIAAASSHEGGIANTSAILRSEGKLTGVDVTPFTIFYEVRND